MGKDDLALRPLVLPHDPRLPGAPSAVSEAVRDAMRAALAGDFTELDRLELEYVNLMVRIGELRVRHADGTPHWWFDERDTRFRRAEIGAVNAPFVVGLVRGFGADARTALKWQLREKCRRCHGRLRHMPCRVCEGRWYVEDMSEHQVLHTDADGVLIEGRG
jgi:hypothetical protein